MRQRSWYVGPLIGAFLGLIILGGGGRAAMRVIVLRDGAPGAFTVDGTITVLFMGAASGAVGAIIRALTDIGDRLSQRARFGIFAVACTALTLRGLKPLDTTRLVLFLPLVAVYVALLELAWQRVRRAEPPRKASLRKTPQAKPAAFR